jgi:hypothetical protein
MLRAFTAYTQEVDEASEAVSEILAQIDTERLLKNSVGLISCYSEYIDTGVVEAISRALPFDVVGCTTLGNAVNGNLGHLELCLMVLTSDDTEFAVASSGPLTETQDAPLRSMYNKALAKLGTEPKFMMCFAPLIYSIGGEAFLNILSDESSGLPIFGTLAVDHTADYAQAQTIINGEASRDSMNIILVGGSAEPKFLVSTLSAEKTLKQKAVITDSEANILKAVNGMSAIDYMETLGLTNDGKIEGASTIPFVIDYGDGTQPVIRAIFAQTQEGYAVCGGSMPINAALSISSIDYEDVLLTTGKLLGGFGKSDGCNAAIMFSCVGRNFALGTKTKDELKVVEDVLGSKLPYLLAYSGGEICPLSDADKVLRNRFHNDSVVALLL